MKKIVDKVSGIFIPVTNMERSTEWYIRIFGLELMESSDICTGLAFPGEPTLIGLWKVERKQPTEFESAVGVYLPYYNFESFDIEFSHVSLMEQGVDVTPIADEGGIKYFSCFDPDGNPIGIVEEMPSSVYYAHKQKYRKYE